MAADEQPLPVLMGQFHVHHPEFLVTLYSKLGTGRPMTEFVNHGIDDDYPDDTPMMSRDDMEARESISPIEMFDPTRDDPRIDFSPFPPEEPVDTTITVPPTLAENINEPPVVLTITNPNQYELRPSYLTSRMRADIDQLASFYHPRVIRLVNGRIYVTEPDPLLRAQALGEVVALVNRVFPLSYKPTTADSVKTIGLERNMSSPLDDPTLRTAGFAVSSRKRRG